MGSSSSKKSGAEQPTSQPEISLDAGGKFCRLVHSSSRWFKLRCAENLESSLRKLIPLVHAGDTKAQQQAASCLANLAVQGEH